MKKFNEIVRELERRGDEATASKMAAYMRGQFRFFGVPAPVRKAACKPLISEAKRSETIDWEFLDQCWADEHREMQYLVLDYLSELQKRLTFDDVARLERYVRSKQWWDTIDGLDRIVGNIAFVDGRINDLMLKWSTDEDFWVRRVAIDHQLLRRECTDTELLEKILTNNFGSREFFINKAIGWSLRDYSKTNPQWVSDFIARHRDCMAPLSIREASKYLFV